MLIDADCGYTKNQSLLRLGANMSWEMSDHDLGHGLIDLCRRTRMEIAAVGLKDGSTEVPIDSYEGLLLYRIMPEISRRLISSSGAQLLILKRERSAAGMKGIESHHLRKITSSALLNGNFNIISEKVRDKFDPDYRCGNTFFASEAIARDVRLGNILEISLNRVAPAPVESSDCDWISSLMQSWEKQCGFIHKRGTWSPRLPEFLHNPDEASTDQGYEDDTLLP